MTPTAAGGLLATTAQTTTPGANGEPATLATLFDAGLGILALGLLAAVVAGAVSFLYRWYVRERIPDGIAVLVGVAAVATWLNTETALVEAIGGRTDLLDPATASFTVAAFVVAGILSDAGRRVGDAAGQRTARAAALRELGEMGQVVRGRGRGRGIIVTLPDIDDIRDIDGYDPLPEDHKADLAGRELTFPRGITVAELEERLVERLEDDHGVGHVDAEVTADGAVEYLAVGSRAAGIGPTLGPGTAAVAVRADPPPAASPGDSVQVWEGGESPRRICTAEFRAAAGDVVTLAVDESDAREMDPGAGYRLVTLTADPGAEREFATLLRAADETMAAVTVGADSTIVGAPLGALDVTVMAVRTADGVEAIPGRSRQVAPGDTVFAIGRPEALRRFEESAGTDGRASPDEEGTDASEDTGAAGGVPVDGADGRADGTDGTIGEGEADRGNPGGTDSGEGSRDDGADGSERPPEERR